MLVMFFVPRLCLPDLLGSADKVKGEDLDAGVESFLSQSVSLYKI